MNKKEPYMRRDLRGKYRLMNGRYLTTMGSFDTKAQAAAWGSWNDFGRPNTYDIVENPDLSAAVIRN